MTLKRQFLIAKKAYTVAKAKIAAKIEHTGLTPEQWVALTEIPERGIPVLDLAERSGLLGPSLSRMISELTRLGVVSKSQRLDDARVCILSVTDHGKKLLARAKR
jgi:DNA-binding MarR family transcriptional regulator